MEQKYIHRQQCPRRPLTMLRSKTTFPEVPCAANAEAGKRHLHTGCLTRGFFLKRFSSCFCILKVFVSMLEYFVA